MLKTCEHGHQVVLYCDPLASREVGTRGVHISPVSLPTFLLHVHAILNVKSFLATLKNMYL